MIVTECFDGVWNREKVAFVDRLGLSFFDFGKVCIYMRRVIIDDQNMGRNRSQIKANVRRPNQHPHKPTKKQSPPKVPWAMKSPDHGPGVPPLPPTSQDITR